MSGACTIVAASVVGFAGVASAHAEFSTSDPAADSILDESPDAIVLTFSERVDAPDDAIVLLDAQGETVDIGDPRQDLGDNTIAVDLVGDGDGVSELDGSYVVSWRAVSADSHPISGAFTFSVGARSSLAPGLIGDAASSAGNTTAPNFWLAVSRMISFGAIALLVGGFVVLAALDPALLTTSQAVRLIVGSAVAGAVATVAMIAAQAAVIGRGPLHFDAWSAVAESFAGRWWFIRAGMLIVTAVLLAIARSMLDRRSTQYTGAGLGVLLLAVVAAGGHATTGRFTTMAFVATVVHLGAMSIWLGGLAAIVIVGHRRARSLLARFSPFALGSVVVLALTGSFNGWRQVGTASGLIDSSYGRWLIVKVVFVIAVVIVAYISRRAVAADAAGRSAGQSNDQASGQATGAPSARTISRSVRIELAGMMAILAATAGLVNAPPSISASGPTPIPVSVTAESGSLRARIDLFPAATGGTTLNVTIFATPGDDAGPVADEIRVTASLPAQQLGPIDIETTTVGPNSVSTDEALFPLPGRWDITVRARFGVFDETVFTESVEIR